MISLSGIGAQRLRAEAIARLQELPGDPEYDHAEADRVLCQLLLAIGFDDVVEAWRKVPKWYA